MSTETRRDLLKKALMFGPAAYVAPMFIGQVATVSAQSLSGAICPQVDNCETFACAQGRCACVPTVNGPTVCVQPVCTGVPCTANANCPPGSVCFTIGCCGPGTFCVPLCPSGEAGAVGSRVPWQRP